MSRYVHGFSTNALKASSFQASLRITTYLPQYIKCAAAHLIYTHVLNRPGVAPVRSPADFD
jgi:hypothetical protein